MKSKEELSAIKDEIAALNGKLAELTEDELRLVLGAGSGENEEFPIHCDYRDLGICGYENKGDCERIMSARFTC